MTRSTPYLLLLHIILTILAIAYIATLAGHYASNAYLLQQYEPPTHHIEFIEQFEVIEQVDTGELERRVQELEDVLSQADVFEVTAYAPLDPLAVEGVCYSGDPNVTASGGSPVPYQTVAASREFEFGQRLWVEGVGVVEVNDRGGAIGAGNLDLVLPTKADALQFGRRELRVIPL